jgi:hypothetical protein
MKMFHHAVFRRAATAFVAGGIIALSFPVNSTAQNFPEDESSRASSARRSATTVDNLGIRYLKLGNSYREARNYDLAQLYLRRGLDMVRNRNTYWEAVGYEYLGLLYRDLGDRQLALEYLRTAASLYDRVISMRDNQGSNDVLRSVIADVEQGYQSPSSPYSADMGEAERLQAENRRLQEENRRLVSKISELESRIRQIESGLTVNPGLALGNPMSLDMSDCKRDLEAVARYRESTLWLNGYAPVDFNQREVRLTGGNARVDGTVIVGYLKRGESAKIDVAMPLGQYIIIADGCAPKARDIDVRIINQQGVVLEKKDIRFSGTTANSSSSSSSTARNDDRAESAPRQDDNQQRANGSSSNSNNSNATTQEDALRYKPSSSREALAKVAWSNEYGGVHSFLVTMYECDSEGAYFCFLIGKK